MRSAIYSTAGQRDYFAIPNDCHLIWLSGCGGGGGGGGANSASGACGGSAAPAFHRVPLSVRAGGVLGILVATGGVGGASGAAGQSISSEGYLRVSSVSGSSLLSPLTAASYLPFFSMGFGEGGSQSAGGGSGPPNIYSVTSSGQASTRVMAVNVNAADWLYAQSNLPIFLMLPFSTGGVGRSGPSNPFNYGLAGRTTLNGWGLGDESASDATYGSGGAGGGGPFGKGGAGGVYSGGIGAGGDATGYGAGGGGGSGGPGPYGAGGAGSPGIVIIEY